MTVECLNEILNQIIKEGKGKYEIIIDMMDANNTDSTRSCHEPILEDDIEVIVL